MKAMTFLTAAFFSFMPVTAFASCSDGHEQASSCMDGFTWDDDTASCVEVVSS